MTLALFENEIIICHLSLSFFNWMNFTARYTYQSPPAHTVHMAASQLTHRPEICSQKPLCPLSSVHGSLSNVQCLVSSLRCPMFNVQCPLSGVHCQVSTVRCPLSSVHCQISTIQSPVSTVHSPLSTVQCPLSTLQCPLSSVQCPGAKPAGDVTMRATVSS